ncbi:conserved protein of unknown function [Moritella yayanosii]|uniref:Uncharacterized protein n=1 Tax=Moritella yayanosii TaxID=69539 RepID=A0A330LQJ4_9GAMM|nr:conserved protein of unknown function [Moritella yayanosii]
MLLKNHKNINVIIIDSVFNIKIPLTPIKALAVFYIKVKLRLYL